MEASKTLLETDSNGKIDIFKIDIIELTPSFSKAIEVLDAYFIQPLFTTLNSSEYN